MHFIVVEEIPLSFPFDMKRHFRECKSFSVKDKREECRRVEDNKSTWNLIVYPKSFENSFCRLFFWSKRCRYILFISRNFGKKWTFIRFVLIFLLIFLEFGEIDKRQLQKFWKGWRQWRVMESSPFKFHEIIRAQ